MGYRLFTTYRKRQEFCVLTFLYLSTSQQKQIIHVSDHTKLTCQTLIGYTYITFTQNKKEQIHRVILIDHQNTANRKSKERVPS